MLFDYLPWLNASLGNTFTTVTNPNKPKRKIYIDLGNQSTPIEIAVSEKRYPFKSLEVGCGLKIKGEYDAEKRFQIFIIEPRKETHEWDIFPDYIGIIYDINQEKKRANFIVGQNIYGVLHFDDIKMKFSVADVITLKLTSHNNDRGIQYSVLACHPTNKDISPSIAKKFKSTVRISNGLGFTTNDIFKDIFIDRPFVDAYNMEDGDSVEGLAVVNYNKKKNQWGWKAIKIDKYDKSLRKEVDDEYF